MRRQEQQFSSIPSLKELPVLGSLPFLQRDRYGFLQKCAEIGPVAGCHMGPFPAIVFNRAEYISSLLIEHAKDIDKGFTQHRAFYGNGVFISEGAFHDRQRRIMTPSFTPRAIASYADIMASYGERLAATWTDGQEINLTKALMTLTTSIVGKTLFDEDVFDETTELGKALVIVFNHAAYMVTHPLSLPASWPTPRNREKDRAWDVIKNRIQAMIDKRRAASEQQDTRSDFLSLLMQARDDDEQPMSDQQLVDECVTLFTGGQETVANALGWAWYFLCQHPDLYQKVQKEVDGVLKGSTPTLDDLSWLPLCFQVFKETIRLYPPASVIIRQALRDIVIENDQKSQRYFVKKGTLLLVSLYAVHRDASLYPEPDMFKPTRFTSEAEKALQRYGFMPFGAGSRICLGNHFAMLEGPLLLATLAQRMTFELLPGQQVIPSSETLTTRPIRDISMVVHHRGKI